MFARQTGPVGVGALVSIISKPEPAQTQTIVAPSSINQPPLKLVHLVRQRGLVVTGAFVLTVNKPEPAQIAIVVALQPENPQPLKLAQQ